MRAHALKSWPKMFAAIAAGARGDLRRADRDFRAGDLVRFNEFVPDYQKPRTGLTGHRRDRIIVAVERAWAGGPDYMGRHVTLTLRPLKWTEHLGILAGLGRYRVDWLEPLPPARSAPAKAGDAA